MLFVQGSSYGVVDDDELTTLKNNCGALLSRQYHIVLPVTFLFYVVMQLAVGWFMYTGGCREHLPVAEWTKQVNVAAAGCFLLSAFHHLTISVLLGTNAHGAWYPRAVYGAAALVSFVAGISACIKIVEQYQYVCIDALGVPTFPSQWPEWMTDVPLLGTYVNAAGQRRNNAQPSFFIHSHALSRHQGTSPSPSRTRSTSRSRTCSSSSACSS